MTHAYHEMQASAAAYRALMRYAALAALVVGLVWWAL